jgi:NAD(P)-dependent dehydrogenase (short-subunit alcohol dehydrogenase family)
MLIDSVQVNRTALQDKVAVVTGAGQGIGRETARILAHLGAAVIIAEINETTGQATEETIRAEGRGTRCSSAPTLQTPQVWNECTRGPLRHSVRLIFSSTMRKQSCSKR